MLLLIRIWGPVLQEACVLRSGVLRDSLLEGQSMWDFASIAAPSVHYFMLFYVFYFYFFFGSDSGDLQWTMHGRKLAASDRSRVCHFAGNTLSNPLTVSCADFESQWKITKDCLPCSTSFAGLLQYIWQYNSLLPAGACRPSMMHEC